MNAQPLAPRHGRIELPSWRPQRHPGRQGALGTHRGLAGLLAIALVGVFAILGFMVANAPGPVAYITPSGPTFDDYLTGNLVREDALGLATLRRVFDPTEIQAIVAARTQLAALAASRQEDRTQDRTVQQIKSGATVVTTPVTLDPIALAASKADERSLDRQVQALKSGAGTVTALPTRFAGKPLPL